MVVTKTKLHEVRERVSAYFVRSVPLCTSPGVSRSHLVYQSRTHCVPVPVPLSTSHVCSLLATLQSAVYKLLYSLQFTSYFTLCSLLAALQSAVYQLLYSLQFTSRFTRCSLLAALQSAVYQLLYTLQFASCFTICSLLATSQFAVY